IQYNDSTKIVDAFGDTLVLRDPSQGDDVVARGSIRYDLTRRMGTATAVNTAVQSGEKWYVQAHRLGFVNDSSSTGGNSAYGRGGWLTSCSLTEPHYHFAAREMKLVSEDVLVARPAVLYIGDIPVMWLPFIFQDLRSGRRSGLIPPRFGVSDIVRNNPGYRRQIEEFGYYFALSDYMDARLTMDWRSGAGSNDRDPGFLRFNGTWNYNWLNRFMQGSMGLSYLTQSDGLTNKSISWRHSQEFSRTSRLSLDANYVTSTRIQRQTTFNPYSAVATIRSNANYTRKFGPVDMQLGGSSTQFPGRDELQLTLPNLSLTVTPLSVGDWFTWKPGLSVSNALRKNIDGTGGFAFRYFTRSDGVVDSAEVKQDTRVTRLSFDTPMTIFGWDIRNAFQYSEDLNDFPQEFIVVNPADSSDRTRRTFRQSYRTTLDWQTGFSLPSLFSSTWRLTPTLDVANVDPGPFLVRSHFSNGAWIHQSKRLRYGASLSPTLFARFGGIGAVSAFRHSISPIISWAYSPAATVSDEYLRATNQTRDGYLGALAQNQVSLNLSTNLEAKLRSPADTNPDAQAKKIKLLSLNFSPLTWDFERASATGKSGFVTDRFDLALRSDLLPGFDFGMGWSLFQGAVTSDTAEFKPFRETIRGTVSLNAQSSLVRGLARMLGINVKATDEAPGDSAIAADSARSMSGARQAANQPIAGSVSQMGLYSVPTGRGWQANMTFSSQRQRPVRGGNVITTTPELFCEPYRTNPFQYQRCLLERTITPGTENPFANTGPGGPIYRAPPTTNLQGSFSFNITPKWAAQWRTTYDFERAEFASHVVSLQRELHDWNAIFAFTQSPNGNFAFNFFIALKAQPELKINYDQRTYRRLPEDR
ncbi:MAG TPA: putative LPS assembly protein LptD, partial [Gemmatimonadaceae bacterium]|nr:putative LPS assembly protein LptD [Gemmatimonadaceae bacterium]